MFRTALCSSMVPGGRIIAFLYLFYFFLIYTQLPPLKFRYIKIVVFIRDSGQQQTDLWTLNSSTSPGTMVHVHHVQFVIFEMLPYFRKSSCLLKRLTHLLKTPQNRSKFFHGLAE